MRDFKTGEKFTHSKSSSFAQKVIIRGLLSKFYLRKIATQNEPCFLIGPPTVFKQILNHATFQVERRTYRRRP